MRTPKWRVHARDGLTFRWFASHPHEGVKAFRTWPEAITFAVATEEGKRDMHRLRHLDFHTVARHG